MSREASRSHRFDTGACFKLKEKKQEAKSAGKRFSHEEMFFWPDAQAQREGGREDISSRICLSLVRNQFQQALIKPILTEINKNRIDKNEGGVKYRYGNFCQNTVGKARGVIVPMAVAGNNFEESVSACWQEKSEAWRK